MFRPHISSSNGVQRPLNFIRTVYTPPGSKSILPKRAARKLLPGKMRPHIYYKFDCVVELSDGSTITRRSQFPKVEWRYIADQRNSPLWNPSKANIKQVEADATGRLATMKKKFAELDSLVGGEGDTTFMESMEQKVQAVQSGGKLSTSLKKKKKK